MKKYIILIGCILLGLTACYKSELDPLTGIYPAPTVVDFTAPGSCTPSKVDGKRIFVLNLSEGGTTLSATLIGNQYYLTSNAYTEAEEAAAKNGNFVLGKTSVNGTQVKTGTITITQTGNDYTMKAVLFLTDGTPYKMTWNGTLTFEPDPEPVKLTEVLTAVSNVASGTNSVTMSLATAGVSYDAATYAYTGSGNYLAVDLYSADGYLHEGVYTASAVGGVINEGEFGIGWDPGDLWGIGWVFENWGTCWWTVDGTDSSAEKITSGTINVERKGSKWVITWGSEETYPNWAVFEGPIEALTDQGGSGGDDYDGVTLTQNFGITDYTGWGMQMVGIELGTPGIVATPGGWGNTYSGEGNYLKLEIYSTDGKIAPGTYKACAEGGVIGEGEFGIGYDGMYGASGTTWYTLAGGETSYQYVTDGTVTVEVDGDNYKITIESSVVNARFGFDEGGSGGEGGDDDDFDGVTLTQFLGSANYTGYGIPLAGVDLGTDGITVTASAWGNTYGGDGNYLKLEFYSTDGSLAPGEYKPCTTGGEVGEGEFGIGYDGAWGASGTTWYTLTGGEASYQYITDGTLKVEKDGDEYTIVLESSVVNIKYVGKLSAE